MSKIRLFKPRSLAFNSIKESSLKEGAQIFLFMRSRADNPTKVAGEPHMVFGPAEGAVHPLKRLCGIGPQFVSSEELNSYSNPEENLIIGVEILKPSGETTVLKYRSKARALTTLSNKHTQKCREVASTKSAWSTYRQKKNPGGTNGKWTDTTVSQ
jgi:hypothetical protein